MKASSEEIYDKSTQGTTLKSNSVGYNAVVDNTGLSSFVWLLLVPRSVKSVKLFKNSFKLIADQCQGYWSWCQSKVHKCTSVCTGLHLHTLLTSFVRWQMSRLVSDSVPVHLHHWLSAAPDSTVGDRAFPVAAARVWNSLPDLVTSAPSVAVFRSWLKTHLFNISYPCDCTVPAQWL